MKRHEPLAALVALLGLSMHAGPAAAQRDMTSVSLGDWTMTGMAQVFPIVTVGAPRQDEGSAFHHHGWYLTQPAIMTHLENGDGRLVLHTTINLEGVTQRNGELTFGGWGEGFIDKRHPHTLLHELMLSYNLWDVWGGDLSLSAGKGFTPYGTDDPMSRPGLKYPTNHHLSQILERWTFNVGWLRGGWSVEAGLFGGGEPEGPYDLSNIKTFPDSWSTRVARRWGPGVGSTVPWEVSISFARVTELSHNAEETTELWNAAVRRSMPLGSGRLYALLEGSRSYLYEHENFFSILGEARYDGGGHQPYLRLEYATRPEYQREGPAGSGGFFRYEDHADPTGTSRWLITSLAYAYQLTGSPVSVRPFVEIQQQQVRGDHGMFSALTTFGTTSFWTLSAGARVFLGGSPMRMGSYGVLDPVAAMVHGMAGDMGNM